jgi:hypothetical protein
LQVMKYNLFSPLLSSVSGERQVLQVTYSTVILLVPGIIQSWNHGTY